MQRRQQILQQLRFPAHEDPHGYNPPTHSTNITANNVQ